ncbi:MAG: type II secretion protein F [Acidimicrobiia bacterium]
MSVRAMAVYVAFLGAALGGYLAIEQFFFRSQKAYNAPRTRHPKSAKTFSSLVADEAASYSPPIFKDAIFSSVAAFAKTLVPYLGASAASGMTAYLVTAVPALGVLGAVAGVWIPISISSMRKRRRVERIRSSWPDACRHLVANLQVGDSLPRALAALGSSGPAELRPYFARFARRYSATGDFDSSVEALGSELEYAGIHQQLGALRLAHRSGGSELVSVLKTAAELASERLSIERDIEARQSWTVTAARISAAAPWVIVVLLSLRPATAAVYSTALGTKVIVGGAIATVSGYALMSKIGKVPSR